MSSLVPAATVALTVEDLCKSYGKAFTVGPLSFSIATGSTTGLLGGNGAGKTTTIGMIMGLIEPTSGSIRVFGLRHGASTPQHEFREPLCGHAASPYRAAESARFRAARR